MRCERDAARPSQLQASRTSRIQRAPTVVMMLAKPEGSRTYRALFSLRPSRPGAPQRGRISRRIADSRAFGRGPVNLVVSSKSRIIAHHL